MKDSHIDWLGEIPCDWQLRRIKFCFEIVKEIVGYEGPPVLACTNTGIKVKDLTYGSGQIAKSYSNYQWVRPGDFVMNNLDLVGGWIDVSEFEGVTSPDYRVFRARGSEYDNSYYRYLFQLCYMDRIFRDTSNVVEGMGWGRMQAPVFKNFVIPVPSVSEQKKIALYLERRCSKLDASIAAAESSIDEYQKYKRSIIFDATTRGLVRATTRTATELEWLSSMPNHWKLVPQKWLMHKTKSICEKWNGETVLSLTVNGVIVRDLVNLVGKRPASFDGYQYVHPGNLLLCLFDIDVTPCCVGLIKNEGVTSPAYSQFYMLPGANARYYAYYLKAIDNQKVYLHLSRNIRSSFTADDFGAILAPRPPEDEQVAIADYLDAKCAQIDAAIEAKRNIVDELKAYKKSLVYEYVTGKREVPCQ